MSTILLNASKNNIKSKLLAELVRKRWHEIAKLSFDSKKHLLLLTINYKLYENRIKTLTTVSFDSIERSEKKVKERQTIHSFI
jgi:hypothetical protein